MEIKINDALGKLAKKVLKKISDGTLEIKKQKEVIKFDHYGKSNAKSQKENELKALEEELYNHPLFNEYIQIQIELNELFSTMAHIIQYKVNKHLSE